MAAALQAQDLEAKEFVLQLLSQEPHQSILAMETLRNTVWGEDSEGWLNTKYDVFAGATDHAKRQVMLIAHRIDELYRQYGQ